MAAHIGSVLRLPRNLHCREYLRADPLETRGEVMDRTATHPVCLHFGLWCPFQFPVPLMENVDHKTLISQQPDRDDFKVTWNTIHENAFKT